MEPTVIWNYIYPSLALLFLAILSYTDIKERIAPPRITQAMLFTGIGLHLLQSILLQNPNPILYSSAVALAMFAVSYSIYLMGGWAGGDVKLFTALGAMIPYYGAVSQATYPIPFPILILAASTISIFPFITIYGLYSVVKEHSKQLKKDIIKSIPKSIYSAFVIMAALHLTAILGIHPAATLLIAPLIYIVKEPGYPLTAFLATLSLIQFPTTNLPRLAYFLAASLLIVTGIEIYKSIKENVLREEKAIEELKEGEMVAEDIWIIDEETTKKQPKIIRANEPGELVIDSRKARGLTEEEIKWLKEKRIKKIQVKKSLPFIPVFFLGMVILLALETFI